MKEKILMIIMGMLIGAIITAACFLIFGNNNNNNPNIQRMQGARQEMGNFEQGGMIPSENMNEIDK